MFELCLRLDCMTLIKIKYSFLEKACIDWYDSLIILCLLIKYLLQYFVTFIYIDFHCPLCTKQSDFCVQTIGSLNVQTERCDAMIDNTEHNWSYSLIVLVGFAVLEKGPTWRHCTGKNTTQILQSLHLVFCLKTVYFPLFSQWI